MPGVTFTLLEFLLRAVLLLIFSFGMMCFIGALRCGAKDRATTKLLLRWFFGCTIFVIITAWALGL